MGMMTRSALLMKFAALHSATMREVRVNHRIRAMTLIYKLLSVRNIVGLCFLIKQRSIYGTMNEIV